MGLHSRTRTNHTTPACTGGGPSSMLRPPCLALPCTPNAAVRLLRGIRTMLHSNEWAAARLAVPSCIYHVCAARQLHVLLLLPACRLPLCVLPGNRGTLCSGGANHTACPDRCCRPRRTPPPVSHHHSVYYILAQVTLLQQSPTRLVARVIRRGRIISAVPSSTSITMLLTRDATLARSSPLHPEARYTQLHALSPSGAFSGPRVCPGRPTMPRPLAPSTRPHYAQTSLVTTACPRHALPCTATTASWMHSSVAAPRAVPLPVSSFGTMYNSTARRIRHQHRFLLYQAYTAGGPSRARLAWATWPACVSRDDETSLATDVMGTGADLCRTLYTKSPVCGIGQAMLMQSATRVVVDAPMGGARVQLRSQKAAVPHGEMLDGNELDTTSS
ncbi:hypothetical protein J3E73DRAFT_262209 [Bipolaris maydis]|nr:hypothetical protein J3E73DRAFT_262209 [Bipolaris maydis]